MQLGAIWRFPVKSMRGETLKSVSIREDGVEGDRVVQIYDARGRMITSRTHPALLGHQGGLDAAGQPTVDGFPWQSDAAREIVEGIVGAGARLAAVEDHRFDVLPLLVATDGAIEAFARDGRRLRPNLIVHGVAGLEERRWEGHRLRVGEVTIALEDLRERCVMTTFDPVTIQQDPEVLRDIVRRFGGTLCLNASVISPGLVTVGAAVTLL